jgi:hypothetical protein
MSTTDRQTESPAERPARLAVWGAAVTAAVAAGTAMLAAPGTAAPTLMGWSLHTKGQLEAPQLEHGVLRSKGSGAGEPIAVRLQAAQPGFLQVDVGDDGSAEFTIDRSGVAKITLDRVASDLQAGTIGLFVDGVAVP